MTLPYSYHNLDRIIARLTQSPATVRQLAAKLHLSGHAVQRSLNFLHKYREAHISARLRNRGTPTPVWSLGPGEDAQKPEPLTTAAKSAAWRARGGDSHQAKKLRRNAARIARASTLAGMLGL